MQFLSLPEIICISETRLKENNCKNKKNYFKNYHKPLPVSFVIYANFKFITQKIDTCQPNDENSFSEKYQKHKDCGYVYKLVCCYNDEYSKPNRV